jgi:tetratricopeptide (TPR) repeat protein
VAETVITYTIRDAGSPGHPALRYRVQVDGTLVAADVALSAHASRSLIDLSGEFNAFFEHPRGREFGLEALKALGSDLVRLGEGWAWDEVAFRLRAGCPRLIVVASELPEILNLPWELLRFGDGFLGQDAMFGIRRLPWLDRPLETFSGELRPRPLRVLFMACAPQDPGSSHYEKLGSLQYEKEEEALLKVLGATPNVAFDSGDLGSFEELRQRIVEFQPHVVHLTGHGIVEDDGLGWFAFEDERGATDPRSSVEMAQKLFAGTSVQCAFISGCQTGKAPPINAVGGICQGLVKEKVPLAIGWAASIADDLATELARVFYDTLARGETVDRALVVARQAITEACEERAEPAWTLPVLYSSTTQSLVFDPDPARPPARPPRRAVAQKALSGMTEGYAEHFVGRRRELQRLLPALRDGNIQILVVTGIGGAGKSALATRLAGKLEAEQFIVVPIPSAEGKPLGSATLLEALAGVFLRSGGHEAHNKLLNPDLEVAERFRYAIEALNQGRYLLVIDNFEVNLDEHSKGILASDLAAFWSLLLGNLAGESRCIITSRYLPGDLVPLPRMAQEEALGELPEAAFLKFLLSDAEVERRYMAGELPTDLLTELHRLLGGTPRFLDQVRVLLHGISKEDLTAELKCLDVSDATSKLRRLRDSYLETIITARLFSYLPEPSQAALCRAAVYNVAVNMESLAAVTQTTTFDAQGFVAQWHEQAFAYPDRDRAGGELWAIHGLLRGWLLSPERLGENQRWAAHQAAGTYLRDLEAGDREAELGLSWIDCLLEARRQFLAAGENKAARDTSDHISGFLARRGLYDQLVRLNKELLRYEEHPGPTNWVGRSLSDQGSYQEARRSYELALDRADGRFPAEAARARHGLATINLDQGNFSAAREGFQRALEIRRTIGDRAGEAASLAQLATTDLNEGNVSAAREGFQTALKILQTTGDRAGEAGTLHNLASIDLREGNYSAAREGFQTALEILGTMGDRVWEARTLAQIAVTDLNQGNYSAAREGFQRSLEIRRTIGDRAGEASTLHQVATVDLNQGNYSAAREGFQTALEIRRGIGDRGGEAATLHNLASIDLNEGNYSAAREGLERSLEILQAIGDRGGEAATLNNLTTIDLDQGNYSAAREGFQTALKILQTTGDRGGEGAALHNLASIDLREGNYSAAREGFQTALEIRRTIGDRAGEAATLNALATIDLDQGNYSAAQEGFQRSLETLQTIGDWAGEAAALHNLATIALREGNNSAAREGFQRSLEMRRTIGDWAGEAITLHQVATIDLREGNDSAAREGFQRSLEMRRTIGDRGGEAAALHNLASIDLDQGNYSAAREGFQTALDILQAIGDRAGEAAVFYQLGRVAGETGRQDGEVRLLGLCFLIDQAIGHGNTSDDWKAVVQAASQLGYADARLKAALEEVANGYRQDRGVDLLREVFGEAGP